MPRPCRQETESSTRSERDRLVLGISGSPRIASTDYVVRAALERAEEEPHIRTEYFTVAGKSIEFCTHCDYCVRTKAGCVFRDDMIQVFSTMQKADAWIVGSPVYQGNISAQTKAVLDRCRALSAMDPHVFRNKLGGAIAVGGDRAGGQEPTLRTILDFYTINDMIPVGGGAFGANLGGVVWSKDKGAEGARNIYSHSSNRYMESLFGQRIDYLYIVRAAQSSHILPASETKLGLATDWLKEKSATASPAGRF